MGRLLPPPANPSAEAAGSTSKARSAPPGVWAQDCALPEGCPPDGLDPAFCLEDPAAFAPTWVDGEVVAVAVDLASLPALAAGNWWTAWGDGVTCDRVAVQFQVGAP